MELPKNVLDAAKKHFADHFGKREHRIVRTASDTHPESKRPVHLIAAVLASAPNDKAVELVFDEDSRLIEPHLRKSLFVPHIHPVDPGIIAAAKVKIDPPVNKLRLGECDKFSETITVTIPKSSAVAPADIYFLADNTGSMGSAISSVQGGASAMLAALSGMAGLQFGVGSYQDFLNAGDPLSAAFQNQQPITNNIAAVTTAINNWIAAGGGDGPEAQLFALDQVAQPSGGSIGWRAGVQHIVVWFGDAPGHDPVCKAVTGFSFDITEPSSTAKLVANNITVLALSLNDGSGYVNGLDDDPKNLLGLLNPAYGTCGAPGGTAGQAGRITAATGGIEVTSVDPTTIVNTIIAKLKALLTIHNVHLQPVGAIAPFVSSITPASYGPLPGDQDNILKFNVTFSGGVVDCSTRDQIFNGAIDVVVDGHVVAAKPTTITVPACKYTYGVKFLCGTQSECGCGCGPVRPGTYATEINILNPNCKQATIVKRVVPLVLSGVATGREPAVVEARATDRMLLPSGAATMDDCCRIAQLLYGGVPESPMPLTIGFLEIISDQELHVTAVYTASDPKGNGLSLEVETVPFKLT